MLVPDRVPSYIYLGPISSHEVKQGQIKLQIKPLLCVTLYILIASAHKCTTGSIYTSLFCFIFGTTNHHGAIAIEIRVQEK
jgi:hypothetical protein